MRASKAARVKAEAVPAPPPPAASPDVLDTNADVADASSAIQAAPKPKGKIKLNLS